MNIAITQRTTEINGFTYDCMSHAWYTLLYKHNIRPISNRETFDISNVDMLILSGGNDSTERTLTERQLVSDAIGEDVPILGVCHGAFMLNKFFDGTNMQIEGHHNTKHPVELEGHMYMNINSYHSIAIHTLGKSLKEIGNDTDGHCEAFKHRDFRIWGVVWHPERMEDILLPSGIRDMI